MVTSRLGFEVDSSQAARASVDLDKLAKSADRAEKAERGLSGASKQADTATGQFARSATGAATATDRLEAEIDELAAAQGRAQTATRASTAALQAQAAATGMMRMQSRQLAFQLIDIGQAIPLAFQSPIFALQNLGFQIAQIGQLYMGQGGMRAALTDSIAMVGRFAVKMGPAIAVVAALGTAFAGLTHEINQTSDVTVTMGDTALAVFQVVRDGIYDLLQPAFGAIAPWMAMAWEGIVIATREGGNFLINTFRAQFEVVRTLFGQLPNIVGGAVIGATNLVIAGLNQMTGLVTSAIDQLIAKLNELPGVDIASIGDVGKIGSLDNPFADALSNATSSLGTRMGEIMASDPLGDFFDAVSIRAQQNARQSAIDDMKEFDTTVAKTNETLSESRTIARGFLGDLKSGLQEGKGLWESFGTAASNALDRIADKLLDLAVNSLFGGATGGGTFASLFGFASGGAFQNGNVIPFASGGVVSSPTMFPMSGGRTGLMGESGPEAIMPLRRGPDGKLGVAASGQSGPTSVLNYAPVINAGMNAVDRAWLDARLEQTKREAVAMSQEETHRLLRQRSDNLAA